MIINPFIFGGPSWGDEFDGSSLGAMWSWTNQGAATAVVSGGVLTMNYGNYSLLKTAVPAGDWGVTLKLTPTQAYAGICVTNAAVTRALWLLHGGGTDYVQQSTGSPLGAGSNPADWVATGDGVVKYYRITKTSVNLILSTSSDGVTFTTRYTEAISAHVITPTYIGLLSNNGRMSYDWIRKTS